MLLQFSVTNHRSIKNTAVISMKAAADKSMKECLIVNFIYVICILYAFFQYKCCSVSSFIYLSFFHTLQSSTDIISSVAFNSFLIPAETLSSHSTACSQLKKKKLCSLQRPFHVSQETSFSAISSMISLSFNKKRYMRKITASTAIAQITTTHTVSL